MNELRIALLASCTADLLQKPLAAALESRGFSASIWVAGFAQFRQEIWNPASALYANEPHVVILYLDAADLFPAAAENPFAWPSREREERAREYAGEVSELAETVSRRLPQCTLLLNTTSFDPQNALAGLEYNSEYSLQQLAAAYNAELARAAARSPRIRIVDVAALAASMGFSNWYDPRLWYLARSRWSYQALQSLAELYANVIGASFGRTRKCVALDLDNTLWGGVVGEDGIQGLRLGEEGIGRAYVEFQLALLNLYRKGVLLAICSKNNPQEALGVIRHHPAMRLREQHFAAIRINWDDKASNLRALAQELNIGLDSIVFLDDSPVERSWVRQSLAKVVVPDWPADPSQFPSALQEISARYFYKLAITAEDKDRGEAYQAQAERRKLAESASSLEDFYRSLKMRARMGPADAFTISRIAQLTQKTNQFNLTTRRYTEAEIQTMSEDPNCAVWWLDLADHFGPNGIVGVLILRRQAPGSWLPGVWLIDTFLLSCRVMGRAVEDAFLATVAQELSAVQLLGEFKPTAKNGPVKELYPRLGFRLVERDADGERWQLDLASASLRSPEWFEIEIARSSIAAA